MNSSSCFNSMNYLNNLYHQVDSRHQSSSKVKKSANSISFVNHTTQSRAASNSRSKRSNELKIKSVNRSFNRRKHQTEKTVTAESGSHNASSIGFNPKMSKNAHFGALYSKIKNKETSYFGLRSSGKKSLAVANPDDFLKEQSQKKELLLLNSKYNNKDYQGLISTASSLVKENRLLLDDPTVRFLIAMSYYKMEQYDLSRLHFEELLKIKDKYKKSVYVFLAICLNNLRRYSEAENYLEKGCMLYPKFYEAKVSQ